MASVSPEGKPVSFIGVPAGGWFGEGALLKNELRLHAAVALRPSVVAYMPRNTFMLLLDASVAFKAIRAPNLVLRKQLSSSIERGIKPRRADQASRVSLALFPRLFDWRDAVVIVRPSTVVRWHRWAAGSSGA